MTSGNGQTRNQSAKGTFGLLALVFALQGVCFTAMRSVHYAGLDRFFMHIIMFAGMTAGLLGFGFVYYRKLRITRSALVLGAGVGLYNTVSMPVVMAALSKLPGTTYFPISACSAVLLDNVFAHYVWGEKLTRPAVSGVFMAILALILIVGWSQLHSIFLGTG
jgi:drug/metabolite transporter (DMT)-like permease